MTPTIPKSRPQKTWEQIQQIIKDHGVPARKLVLVFWRGYYRDTMGKPGVNDRGIHDDAFFVWSDVPGKMRTFNGNTDPTRYRKGFGTGANKGMACVEPGVMAFTRGLHKGKYRALRQYGTFKIKRDGSPDYIEMDDDSGINVHHDSPISTSSEGCFTTPESQWDDYIDTVDAYATYYKIKDSDPIVAILLEGQG